MKAYPPPTPTPTPHPQLKVYGLPPSTTVELREPSCRLVKLLDGQVCLYLWMRSRPHRNHPRSHYRHHTSRPYGYSRESSHTQTHLADMSWWNLKHKEIRGVHSKPKPNCQMTPWSFSVKINFWGKMKKENQLNPTQYLIFYYYNSLYYYYLDLY